MESFSFNSEFEITVNHSKEDAFDRFYDYVIEQSSLKVTVSKEAQ